MITDIDSSKVDEAMISEKIPSRLSYAIPSYLQFNHLLFLSMSKQTYVLVQGSVENVLLP